ncbi:MAG: glycosyltransferase, partial [Acholeplasmatales bacterium]|nr:glycosyltransferase [Acholeplasmatales bacterium]
MSHFLDIIIPEYDCPIEFMIRLLDSINKQKNIEVKEIGIIIVNDKSKNKYKKSWFKQRYPKLNIEYLVKDINEGQGLTRQYGLDRSEATYVTFIDQDDMLYEYDNLAKVINYIKEHNDDIYFTEYLEETYIDNKLYIQHHDPIRLRCLHGLFLNRLFLINNKIRFSNKIRYHEDVYLCDLLYYGYK